MKTLQEKFESFKKITGEENKIIELIKKNCEITPKTKILEIGSNKGNISMALQKNKNNITCIDIEEFNFGPEIKFIKNKWEEAKLEEDYDLIIASHVWGHFYHNKSTQKAFNKAIKSLKNKGKLILCYNSNNDFVRKLVDLGEKLFNDFEYDSFDESLLGKNGIKEEIFSVTLKRNNFDELADLIQVLIIVPDEKFKAQKQKIIKFLKSNLKEPKFEINQKMIILK